MITVEKYGNRNWAVYEKGELLCVTVYKKGAKAVKVRLESLLLKDNPSGCVSVK